jgi:hypothetical protein
MRIRIRDPDSFLPWIRDPGWKNAEPGSIRNTAIFYDYMCEPQEPCYNTLPTT